LQGWDFLHSAGEIALEQALDLLAVPQPGGIEDGVAPQAGERRCGRRRPQPWTRDGDQEQDGEQEQRRQSRARNTQ
jgi:hypothetical protein